MFGFSLNLATRGADFTSRFGVLKRHLYAFARHMTLRKMINFALIEFSRIRRKSKLSGYPYIMKVESTNVCNVKCAFCYNERRSPREGERPYGRMPFETFKALVDDMRPYLFKINLFGYGEPLLFPESFDMIRYATDANIGVAVSSNLCLDTPDLARKVVESGLEVLIFSAHGVTPESYNKFMGKADMELAFANVRAIREERDRRGLSTPLIDWQYCVTGFNEAEIEQARIKADEIGADQVRFIQPYFPKEYPEEWFATIFDNDIHNPGEMEPACSWLYRAAYINHDGGVMPCCTQGTRRIADDYGNVTTGSFRQIWNSERYIQSRRLAAKSSDDTTGNLLCHNCYGPEKSPEVDINSIA